MLKNERQARILTQLETQGIVRIADLVPELHVDPVTIRRDLAELETGGHLHRVHGGATRPTVSRTSLTPPGLEKRIAEAAARIIPDNSVVFIGTGTLTHEIVPFWATRPHLTIITNAIDIAWTIARQQRHTLHLLGGQVAEDYCTYGVPEVFRKLRADWVILEAEGLDAERGLTHTSRAYAAMMRGLLALNVQVLLVLTPERLGRAGAIFTAPASAIDILVTGREASNAILWDLSEIGIRIVLT